MLGKLLLPGIVALGFVLYTNQPNRTHTTAAYISQACDAVQPAVVRAAFAWPPPVPGAEQTWVDLGLDASFALGWYQGHGPLPPAQNTFSIGGLTASLKYYYRVNTLTAAKWTTVAKGSFVSACASPAVAATTESVVMPTPFSERNGE